MAEKQAVKVRIFAVTTDRLSVDIVFGDTSGRFNLTDKGLIQEGKMWLATPHEEGEYILVERSDIEKEGDIPLINEYSCFRLAEVGEPSEV